MKTIASFTVDHDKLTEGMYVSRVDGDVITYDIRMVRPNGGVYVSSPALHTFEHLFATYVRNSKYSDQIIYVGPMGCRTGFYFLTRDTLAKADAIQLVRDCFAFIADFAGKIPGSEKKECGNYLEHDLPGARAVATDMCQVLNDWTEPMLSYDYQPEGN